MPSRSHSALVKLKGDGMDLGEKRGSADAMRKVEIREQLDPTSRAVMAAHESHIRESMASVYAERRRALQRLTHTERAAG
jgi:hypothetical protein